jgi:hypothetical protein
MADIVLKWKGQEIRIPDSRAFEAGAALEDVVTLSELQAYTTRPKFFTIAKAMGCLLRFAGVKVSDREVKAEIDASILRAAEAGVNADDAKEVFAVQAIGQLVAVLFDGAPPAGEGETPGETSAS